MKCPLEVGQPVGQAGALPVRDNGTVDKTIRRYTSFSAMKDDEYREWQAMPAHARLAAAWELSLMQYRWQENGTEPNVQQGLHLSAFNKHHVRDARHD